MKLFPAFVLALLITPAAAQEPTMIERGQAIAAASCGSCHAIAREGASPHAEAPPLRDIAERYSLDSLEEAFGEGIHVGHADMPEFRFQPDEISALLLYMRDIHDNP